MGIVSDAFRLRRVWSLRYCASMSNDAGESAIDVAFATAQQADGVQRGKGQQYWTVRSDLVHGEIIGLARDRTQESLAGLTKEHLDTRQRASVKAVCIDMHQPYVNAFAEVLPKAEVVFDKFHV